MRGRKKFIKDKLGKKDSSKTSELQGEIDLSEQVLSLLRRTRHRPLSAVEIARELRAEPADAVKQLVKRMEQEGQVVRIRKDRYILPKEADLYTGRITFNPKGFAFVDIEGEDEDLFIAPGDTGTALQADRVVVRLNIPKKRGRQGDTRTSGHVVRVLERAHETVVGTLQQSRNFYYVIVDDPRFLQRVYVSLKGKNLPSVPSAGNKVVVKLYPWESPYENPEGEIVEVLGAGDAPGVDMLSIIRKFHLPQIFPPEVLEEAQAVPDHVLKKEYADRMDCRKEFIVTIDPDDARDFDDAIQVIRTKTGWKLSVHIADVSHYVQSDTALDREAYKRGNSVYLPDRVLPMLPESLSNGICSLRPDEDRLTFGVFIDFKADGSVRSTKFAPCVIRSAKRLTYREALEILNKKPETKLEEAIHTAWELASILRKRRFQQGALDLDFPELKVWVDSAGKPIRLEKQENDISHQLIEEFMLAANDAVARYLRGKSEPSIYRVHEEPKLQRIEEFREFVQSHEIRIGDLTKREEIQKLLQKIKGIPEEQGIKIALLKSLQKARYDPKPLGHYGLAKSNYTHFTSPIRRYADLVVHRVLRRVLTNGKVRYTSKNLGSLAKHISDTERIAMEAERESVKLKKLEFLEEQAAQGTIFSASIIDVRNYGLVVEIPQFMLEGTVRISAMPDDFYTFDSIRLQFRGRQTRKIFSVGQTIQVRVGSVDPLRQSVNFLPA